MDAPKVRDTFRSVRGFTLDADAAHNTCDPSTVMVVRGVGVLDRSQTWTMHAAPTTLSDGSEGYGLAKVGVPASDPYALPARVNSLRMRTTTVSAVLMVRLNPVMTMVAREPL
jgi:hypothetical protein